MHFSIKLVKVRENYNLDKGSMFFFVQILLTVPFLMQSCTSADEYMQKLPSFDEDWARERKNAEAAGEVSVLLSLILFMQWSRACLRKICIYHVSTCTSLTTGQSGQVLLGLVHKWPV